jgi:hypothetical protein
VRDCLGGTEAGDAGEVAVTDRAVRDTLRSGLFTSRGASRVGWAHQTFAEHLAGRFLIYHGVRGKPLRDLLLAPDGHVYPQLRPVAAWLMALPHGEFDWLATQDPELLLAAPIDISRSDVRKQAVDALFHRAATGAYSHRSDIASTASPTPALPATSAPDSSMAHRNNVSWRSRSRTTAG